MNKKIPETEELWLQPFTIHGLAEVNSKVPSGVQLIQAPSFWKEADEGLGTVVAVLDTGVDMDHPNLVQNIIGGRNFTTDYGRNPNNFDDNNGHGTHVAGTICATFSDNLVGVAPKTKILALKVLTGEGSGSYQWVIEAIRYACEWRGPNGETVDVMNLSLGGPYNDPTLHEAVKRAVNDYHIPIICASGNSGDNDESTFEYDYPSGYNEVISVGAVDLDKRLAPFSNVNEEVDLVAPGVNILSTYPGGQYAKLSGTSMATPHVSGALALLKIKSERQFGRKMTEAELYAQLIKRCVPLEYTAQAVGNGLLQLTYMDKYRELVKFIEVNFSDHSVI